VKDPGGEAPATCEDSPERLNHTWWIVASWTVALLMIPFWVIIAALFLDSERPAGQDSEYEPQLRAEVRNLAPVSMIIGLVAGRRFLLCAGEEQWRIAIFGYGLPSLSLLTWALLAALL